MGQSAQVFQELARQPKSVQQAAKQVVDEFVKVERARRKAAETDDLKKTAQEVKNVRKEVDSLGESYDKAGRKRDSKGKFLPGDDSGGGSRGKKGKGGDLINVDVAGTVKDLAAQAGLAYGAAEFIKKAVVDSAEYGRKLSELSSLTGAVGKELAYLDQQAQNLQDDTGIAAGTIIDTFKAVGSIQPELLENRKLLADTTREVIALAQAGSITLPEAAQAALGALNQFGEGADQAGRFVNVLAAGALKGSSEIDDTTRALQNSGAAMKAAGLSFEQGNALIQATAGIMIKGSEAGTGLRNVLLKLETDTDKNLRPSLVGLDKALENAAKKYDTTTELTKTFGVENILVARRVLDARVEIGKLTKELTGTDVAYQQQRINTDNLVTDLDKAGSAITGFFTDIGRSQDGLLRRLTQGFTSFVQSLTNKGSELRALFRGYSESDSFTAFGKYYDAYDAVQRQREANLTIARRQAEVKGINSAAVSNAESDIKALTDLYTKQGQTAPEALRRAVENVKKQRDKELSDAVATQNQLRAKLETQIKTTGDDGSLNKEFDRSRQRLTAARAAKGKADNELNRLNKLDADRQKTLDSLQGEGPTDKEKKQLQHEETLSEQRRKNLLKQGDDVAKIEQQLAEARLNQLDKNSDEYLTKKREIDLKELEQTRQALIRQGQELTGYEVVNAKTGVKSRVLNKEYTLPASTEKAFQDSRDSISSTFDRDAGRAAETKFDLERGLKMRKEFNDAEDKYDIERAKKKETLQRNITENGLELQRALNDATDLLIRKSGENELDYEKRKSEELLRIKLEYAKKALALAAADPTVDKGAVEGLRETIAGLESELKGVKKQRKQGPQDLFDLFGIKFDVDPDKNDEIKRQANEAISLALDGTNQILNAQIASDQSRVESIDRQLEAKQREVDIERDLAQKGLGNRLGIKRQEEDQIKAERQKAINAQRRDQAIQLSLNAVLQQSELALAVAKIFNTNASIPLIGYITAGIQIAAMIGLFSSTVSQISNLPKYHSGDEVTLATARQRSIGGGSPRPDEVDARLQIGEGVINKKSFQANKGLFLMANALGRPLRFGDLAGYIQDNPLDMLPGLEQANMQKINQNLILRSTPQQPDTELHRRVDEMSEQLKQLNQTTKSSKYPIVTELADGRFRIVDEKGNIKVTRLT